MENAISLVFVIVFYLFYSIRSFPLPKFIAGGMQPKERESLNRFIRVIGMLIGMIGMNTYLLKYLEVLVGGNYSLAFLIYIGVFFLLKILIDIFRWKIGALWVAHLLVYLIWTGIVLLIIYVINSIGISTDTTFGMILILVLIISLVAWLYYRYFHEPWKFSKIRQTAQ